MLKQKSTLDERGGALQEKKPRTKAMVLLSGGLDSGVFSSLLGMLSDEASFYRRLLGLDSDPYDLHCLSLLSGQRHQRELDAAATLAQALSARHTHLDLSTLRPLLAGSALTDASVAVPSGHSAAPTMQLTVVPNRNALLLSIACALAVAEQADVVAAGMHAGDHPIYPDCRSAFVQAFQAMEQVACEGYAAPGLRVGCAVGGVWESMYCRARSVSSCPNGADLELLQRRGLALWPLWHLCRTARSLCPGTYSGPNSISRNTTRRGNQWMKACCLG